MTSPPSCPISPSLVLLPGSLASPFLPSPHTVSACPFLHPHSSTFPFSPNTSTAYHCFQFPSPIFHLISPPVFALVAPSLLATFSFISSLQSRNGQVYLWGDTRLSPCRPACPILTTPHGPACGTPRPAGHALRYLPLQLHRPQACALLGSTTCLPRATAGLGSLHCQDGSGQWQQES